MAQSLKETIKLPTVVFCLENSSDSQTWNIPNSDGKNDIIFQHDINKEDWQTQNEMLIIERVGDLCFKLNSTMDKGLIRGRRRSFKIRFPTKTL